MEKKMMYLERLFCILSIVFFLITIILLIINCFKDISFELAFFGIFAIVCFINQVVFIPGDHRIFKREYKHKLIHNLQIYTAMVMLVALLASEWIAISDNVTAALFGGLLFLFLIFYSCQNIAYSFNYDKSKKVHVIRRLLLAIFLTSSSLIILFYLLITYFRGVYV